MSGLETQLRALMVAGMAGDAAAYRSLLTSLGAHLRSYFLRRLGSSRSADADDLVQETLMAVHSRRATYDPARPFTAWVHAVARYKLIDHLRSARLRSMTSLDDDDALFADDAAEPAMARLDVDRLLGALPAAKGDLVRKVRLEGASIAEAAAQSGLSEAAVKVGIHRAIKSMGASLKGEDDG